MRLLIRLLTGLGLVIGLVATLRLALVVAATPTAVWLDVFPPLVDVVSTVDPSTQSRAQLVARFVHDPALIRGRLGDCQAPIVVETDAERSDRNNRCLALIDTALAAEPSSGELWLFKAERLLDASETGPGIDALRNSYRTAPREGWIASGRVVIGLQLYPLLPPDLLRDVSDDLRLVLQYPDFATPLTTAYIGNPALRQAAAPALGALPPELFKRFIAMARPTS